ncbi:Immunoglobulin [Sergentomyia squamirostris]
MFPTPRGDGVSSPYTRRQITDRNRDFWVMWVRKTTDKVSLLTVGNVTYSGDPRIGVKFQYPNNWRLHINPIQREDAGLYMCQVSTHPPRVFATNVTVLAPAIRVVDEHGHEVHDRYYKMGSAIDLTCQVAVSFLSVLPTVMPAPNPPHYSHQRQFPFIPKLLNFTVTPLAMPKTPHSHHTTPGHSTGGAPTPATFPHIPQLSNLRINTIGGHRLDDMRQLEFFHQKLSWRKDGGPIPKDVQLNLSATTEWRSSRLSIAAADRSHSGEYSCSILNSSAAVVHVQVLNGEMPAAVQHNSATIGRSLLSILVLFLFFSPLLHISC